MNCANICIWLKGNFGKTSERRDIAHNFMALAERKYTILQ